MALYKSGYFASENIAAMRFDLLTFRKGYVKLKPPAFPQIDLLFITIKLPEMGIAK